MTASAWSPNAALITQANAQGLLKMEAVKVTGNTKSLNIETFAYTVGTGSLVLFKNGKILKRNSDYLEVGNAGTPGTNVLLTDDALAGDEFVFVGFVGVQGVATVDATLRNDITGTNGGNLIQVTPDGVGAVTLPIAKIAKRTLHILNFTTSDITDGVHSATDAMAKAIAQAALLGGADIYTGPGKFLFNPVSTSADGYADGFVLPDLASNTNSVGGINIIGEGVNTQFLAGADNMIIARGARHFSGVRNVMFKGNGHNNVIGAGLIPADMTQTTKFVSHSYQTWDISVEDCAEAMVIQPGPTVAGADSGCFYHKIKLFANKNKRAIWAKTDVTGNGNRMTRSEINAIVLRGNTGIQLDYASEVKVQLWAEMINSAGGPNATPVAMLISANNIANIKVSGYAEACTRGLVALDPTYVDRTGWMENGAPDGSTYSTTQLNPGICVIGKVGNSMSSLHWGNPSFVSLRADPDQTGSKTLGLYLNDVEVKRWGADRKETFKGTLANIEMNPNGTGINFTYNGSNIISASGASGVVGIRAAGFSLQNSAGVEFLTASAAEFIPRIDNATSNGINGLRWSAIWAANGTIQTSDVRTKKDIKPSPLGLEFINSLKPVCYRFIVGGRKIVGVKEIVPAEYNEEGQIVQEAKVEPIVEDIPGNRIHYGLLTQDVKAALDASGVEDFAGYVKADLSDPESEEGLRLTDFIAPMIKGIQTLTARLEIVEAELAALKAAK
jgi:hypothetical protein